MFDQWLPVVLSIPLLDKAGHFPGSHAANSHKTKFWSIEFECNRCIQLPDNIHKRHHTLKVTNLFTRKTENNITCIPGVVEIEDKLWHDHHVYKVFYYLEVLWEVNFISNIKFL